MHTDTQPTHVVITESAENNVITVEVTGKLTHADYQKLVPAVENMLDRHDRVRMLVILREFHGWTAGALWDDLKFDFKHYDDIDRLALVGDSQWENGMAVFCKPFSKATVKYFNIDDLDAAKVWIAD